MLPPTPPMDLDRKRKSGHNALPLATGFSDMTFEPLDDGFCMDNLSSRKSCCRDFQNFNHLPVIASPFNPNMGMQAIGVDSFDPFCHGSSDFSFNGFKPYEEIGTTGAARPAYQGVGFFNFPFRKDSLMGSWCATADVIGCHKDGKKPSDNSIQKGKSSVSESASTTATGCSRGLKKSKSAKGLWTIEEDRLLIQLVEKYGARKWSRIAPMLNGRLGKQCRERWHNHLRPDIKKG